MFPLHRTWSLYFHAKNKDKKYTDNKQKLIDISDVLTFWQTMNNVPTPSEMFSDGVNKKVIGKAHETPAALSFFAKGIDPCWEDPKNVNGGEWSIRKFKDISGVDELWKNLLVDVISERFDNSERINGVRVVDCTRDSQVMYRVEIWFDSTEYASFFEKKIKELCSLPNVKLLYRDHKSVKETI